MDIKKLLKKNKPTFKEDLSKFLGFEQKDCLHTDISDMDNNIEKFVIRNNNIDTYISSYSQNDINAGIIFGLPSNLYPYFNKSVELVNNFFKEDEVNAKDVLFLKPIIYTEYDSNTQREAYLLPPIFTIATFDKFEIDEENKTLRVAWWQNDYGIPERNIIEELEKIEWKKTYFHTWEL